MILTCLYLILISFRHDPYLLLARFLLHPNMILTFTLTSPSLIQIANLIQTSSISFVTSLRRRMRISRVFFNVILISSYIPAQASTSSSPSTSQPDTSFVEDAIRKLLKARRVLRASYGYGFFLGRNQQKKIIFELMQVL